LEVRNGASGEKSAGCGKNLQVFRLSDIEDATLPAIFMLVDRQDGKFWKGVWELFEHYLILHFPAMIISLHLYIGTYLA